MKNEQPEVVPQFGWVLYDASCGFCSWWVPLWSGLLHRNGFAVAQLQADWVRRRLVATGDDLLQDIRILTPDGAQVRGADVYRVVMRHVWWLVPIYLLSILPLVRQAFDAAYRA